MNEIKIKELRAKIGVSQEEFAKMIGVHPRTVQNWEGGGVIPAAKHELLRKYESEHAAIATDDSEEDQGNKEVIISREVFEQISRLTEVVLSQQKTIEILTETTHN